MNISTQGLDLIKFFEGFRNHVYNDVIGIPAIAYRHALKSGEAC
jgi:GH24 family phage-related lysozyme (muramidase)